MAAPFEHVLELADSYYHDLLTPEQNEYVEQHCEQCRICKAALEEAEKRLSALKQLPASEATPELVQSALARIARHESERAQTQAARGRWIRRGAWLGAAVAVLFFGLHVYYWTLAPAPYDLRVLCQSKLHAGTKRSLRVELVNPVRGSGLANVPIKIEIRDPATDQWVHLAEFKTDAEGTGQPLLQLPDWKDGAYDLRVSARSGWRPQTIVRPVQLVRSWKLMLTSDRPVYQPGQTIQVRSLALRSLDLKPIAGQTAIFSVADPAGNIIFKQKEVTSQFGIASTACPLAHEILHGPYTIQCQVGDTTSKLAVEVKPYVLPKFKIDLVADQPYYQPGQRVGGTLHTAYFFGKPVADADVELHLAGGGAVLGLLKLRTDAKGTATFAFPPLPETFKDRDLALELSASVTDRAGQAQVRKISLSATTQPLRIEVILEGGTLVAKLPNRAFFFVHDVIGRPTRARIAFSAIDKELTTNALGVASFDFTPTGQEIEWSVRATDVEDGRRVGRKQATWKVGQADDDFLFRTDKAVYAGGESMRLTVLSAGSEPVLVDVHKDGQTLLTAAIPVAKGSGETTLDLPSELAGTMQLSAYRLGPNGTKGIKTRLVYIRPASQVRITTTLDRAEYQPGKVARLRFQLADPLGKPIPGALSLAAVDEAVFAVLQQSAGAEQPFYTVSNELLRPALQIASWSPPAPDKEEERRTFDQALFALSANAQKPPADREAIIKALLPYVDNNRRVFDVIDDPLFEKLVRDGSVPESVLAVLRNPQGPTTFLATTYPENVRAAQSTDAALSGFIKMAWIVIGISVGILGLAYLIYRLSKVSGGIWELLGGLMLVSTCLCLMVPATQKVREASARTQVANNVRNLEFAIAEFQDANKKLPGIPDPAGEGNAGPRVREWFPETLLWRPELITDDQGRANLDIPLADSITTWRLTASAVTLDGRLGASHEKIKVFQPFFVELNLPIALTLDDEVAVPVVVYNYLDLPQDVELVFTEAAWYESKEAGSRRLALQPGEVRSTHFRLRARKVGTHELQVTAAGSGVADAVKRRIDVLPGGRRIETVWNGNLHRPTEFPITLPDEAIPGSGRLFVKVYPSQFSQVVEGLDSIFRLPSGCFEQTSSTTYPNVLALDYLQRTKKNSRAVEDKTRKYINLGYQRLVSFEVAGGGFDWFGRPPANQALSAYGLMEFEDMSKVHDVDPRLIERTRAWLLKQRRADGSWAPEGHVPAGAPGRLGGAELARLSTTAYIAWAVFRTPAPGADARGTQQFLLRHRPDAIRDPHVLALVCNALRAIDPSAHDAGPYLDRLDALKRSSADGKQVWWEQPLGGRTTFHGSGRSGSVETTALASLAFLESGKHLGSARAALTWIVQQQDSGGTWHSTQATVLALKAMLAGTGSLGEERERRIEWTWSQGKKETLVMPADQAEVMKQIDLSAHLSPGKQTLTLAEPTGAAANFQVAFRYHVPVDKGDADSPLALSIKYDREKLSVGETVMAVATVANRTTETAPMVMVELPIPAGFTVVPDSLRKLMKDGQIDKHEVQPLAVLVYLRELPAGKSADLAYGLRAVMPAQVTVPAARAYEYYNPDREGRSTETRLTVIE